MKSGNKQKQQLIADFVAKQKKAGNAENVIKKLSEGALLILASVVGTSC